MLDSPEQMLMLYDLLSGEKTASQIIESCMMHRAAATKMLRKLHIGGFITSRQYGKNQFHLIYTITPAGIDAVNNAIEKAARLGWDFEEVGRQWIEDRAKAAKNRNTYMMFADYKTN